MLRNANDPVFLRNDVQIEPLVDRWYAWLHLLAPATASRNLTERHFRIMESYIEAPAVHAAAVKNPRMAGGPFMNYPQERVDNIKALLRQTKAERGNLIELSQALVNLNTMLEAKAKGFSLNELYAEIPIPLRGCVELSYDLNNHPSFRLIESLLYHGKYHDTSGQSLMLSLTEKDDRPFVMSTPRLDEHGTYNWRTTFNNEAVDALMRMKKAPRPYCDVCDLVKVSGEQERLFRSFFTEEAPPPYKKYTGPKARWRYFGHACVLIETATTSIMFDPVISYTYKNEIPRYTYQDIPETLDYVVITHNHQDHVMLETLLQLRHKIGQLIVPRGNGSLQDPSMLLSLRHAGFNNVREVSEFEEILIPEGSILPLPFFGEHSDLNIWSKLAYLIRLGGHSLMFAADSCNMTPEFYQQIRHLYGPVEALFLGMECVGAPLTWVYGPLLGYQMDRAIAESRRLAGSDYEQALDMVTRMACSEVYIYAMGQEPWLNHVMNLKYNEQSKPIVDSNRLLSECRRRGIVAERLFGEREMFLDM